MFLPALRAFAVGRAIAPRNVALFPIRTYVTKSQRKILSEAEKNSIVQINPITGTTPSVVTERESRVLREDPLLSQIVNTIMKDGKKSRAQRIVNEALRDIQRLTKNDPYKVLADAIEQISPLMITKSAKKGSKVIQVPKPLSLRQRRRRAILWILEACDGRNERSMSLRLSAEIQAIINGTSSTIQKKLLLHQSVLANRANIPVSRN
ncbi:hypothetical protein H4219_001079 [Mycoemilia scoparia]|uniref:Small ribosomal subunit protein uS7 domain-containing protein n=1 Tax=Mycoemilia scoparia TaxID=417184 RepID=A0A9W8A191_9FUNG|nr:hypothetical protein H4219_001079 [Mycoemilia scoparia]